MQTFWAAHDPQDYPYTHVWPDSAYRSRVFYTTEAERRAAVASKAAVQAKIPNAIVTTTIDPAPYTLFWPAEDYHQDYLKKNNQQQCPS